MGFFSKLKEGLKKTKDSFVSKVERLVNTFTKIDEDFFEELLETLIMSDIGAVTSENICDRLRAEVKRRGATDTGEVKGILKEIVAEMLSGDNELDLSRKPAVVLVIGVNGAGKTTTIGKLAYNLRNEGKRVLVAAADTFRAAAIEQLNVWTDRAGVEIIKHGQGSDPAAVVFDSCTAAKARNADVLLIDTAGRLHNKKNLMDELKKISRIIGQQLPESSVETLLVLDATTGQNAVNQARLFKEVCDITGIILTKLDGTAKGGIILPIKDELGIPVKLVGVGEKIDDLQPFIPEDYAEILFSGESEHEADDEPEENEDIEDENVVSDVSDGENADIGENDDDTDNELNYEDEQGEQNAPDEQETQNTDNADSTENAGNDENDVSIEDEEEKPEEEAAPKKRFFGFFKKR